MRTVGYIGALTLVLVGCDLAPDQVGAQSVLYRTVPDGEPEPLDRGCFGLLPEEIGGGLTGFIGGPEYGTRVLSEGGSISFEYYIAPPEHAGDPDFGVTPENGELAAELHADADFYRSDDVRRVTFETHDGIRFEAVHWGTPGCPEERPDPPPPGE